MHMISFIVIGRNEGWKLQGCFKSIHRAIDAANLEHYEVLYVDSASSDNSVELAKLSMEKEGRVYRLTGHPNAAIARNVGADRSGGDILFFIDGDMEIDETFLPLVYDEDEGLKYDFVSGQVVDYNYDYQGRLIRKSPYHNITGEQRVDYTTGGLFLIRKNLWIKVGGMKEKLRRNQDLDLGLRLAMLGVFLVRRKETLAIHHTIAYDNSRRMWSLLLDGSELYPSVVLRDNMRNRYEWKMFARENYSGILLISCTALSVGGVHYQWLAYVGLVLLRTVYRRRGNLLYILKRMGYYIVRDCCFWVALILFWPSNRKQYRILDL